jgi:hypothetical protein
MGIVATNVFSKPVSVLAEKGSTAAGSVAKVMKNK